MEKSATDDRFWSELRRIIRNRHPLKHPFYRRWEHGDLTTEDLAFYAGEYAYAVHALGPD